MTSEFNVNNVVLEYPLNLLRNNEVCMVGKIIIIRVDVNNKTNGEEKKSFSLKQKVRKVESVDELEITDEIPVKAKFFNETKYKKLKYSCIENDNGQLINPDCFNLPEMQITLNTPKSNPRISTISTERKRQGLYFSQINESMSECDISSDCEENVGDRKSVRMTILGKQFTSN
jgi:hypothetical protein